jgi:transcriptional regulator with XRE-family HTH domain
MRSSLRLDILRDLRERAGLTQGDMARLCGLYGQQSHQTAGAWERGEMIPNRARRAKFIGYLWDHLGLGKEPARFEEVWLVLVEEWDWAPIGDAEWADFTRLPRQARAGTLDKRVEQTLRLNYDRLSPEDARHAVVTWVLMNMALFGADKPVWYEVKLQTLELEAR